uniref:Uncharacterized protein n=1 Tax=viral metagenome TaxID=1070528 RepID=A0A6M3IG74_9ZZZZ
MGKKYFVISEVVPRDRMIPEAGYKFVDDPTSWIDSRHVIEGGRLRYAVPKKGCTFFEPYSDFPAEGIWGKAEYDFIAPQQVLILDPPKAEGDEWEEWITGCPAAAWRNWFRRMPKKP